MSLEIIQPSPTYVVIASIFMLEESVGERLSAALVADYRAEVEAVGAGWTVIDPRERKTMEANRIRASIRAECCAFIAEHLPGFFAGQGPDSEVFPAGDLIFLESTSVEKLESRKRGSFLESLGLDSPVFDYLGVTHPGLLLRLPGDSGQGDRVMTFAATMPELLPGDELPGYAGRTPDGFVHRLHGLSDLVGLWAVASLLTDLDALIADARDELGAELNTNDADQRRRLEDVQRVVARLISDFRFTLHEWMSGGGLSYLAEDAPDFKPRESALWLEGPIAKVMAANIKGDAERIVGTIAFLQEALQVQSALVAARASERATQTNLVLQGLTILLAVIAVVVAVMLSPK